jgi:hypothetical protein
MILGLPLNIFFCDASRAVFLAFAASKFANRLKPLLALGLGRTAISVVLLRILALFGHVNDPRRWLYLQ